MITSSLEVYAAYFNSSSLTAFSVSLAPTVIEVTDVEYWIIKGGNATVSLSWRNTSALSTYNPDELTIVGYRTATSTREVIPSLIDATSIYGSPSDIASTGSTTSSAAVDLSLYETFTFGRRENVPIWLLKQVQKQETATY